jgi:putative ABC transport system permease protein
VNRRRPEIALRLVVGASRGDVLRWVLARGLGPVVIGLVLGLAGAIGVGRLLRRVLFNVPSTAVSCTGEPMGGRLRPDFVSVRHASGN